MKIEGTVEYIPGTFKVDGETIYTPENISECYHSVFEKPYPKFHKMDILCKTALLSAEPLLSRLNEKERESTSIIAFTSDGCVATDREYSGIISNKDEYFPSPAVFVYTLPNILTGEIAIRHKCKGETSLYEVENPEDKIATEIVEASLKRLPEGGKMLVVCADAIAPDNFKIKTYLLSNGK